MTTVSEQPALIYDQVAGDVQAEHRSLLWSGLLAGLVACGVPLIGGLAAGWSEVDALGYGALALLYLTLTQLPRLPFALTRWLCRRVAAYLLLMGLLSLGLQIISGDPFIQPIVFTVPLVFAALEYPPPRAIGVALLYLGLMVLGLWLAGLREPEALAFPLIGYGTVMVLIFAFTRLSVEQTIARQRADALAATLAHERDYLAHLVAVTATLTRDLDLVAVLEQVAAAGCALAPAGQVRVWLRDADDTTLRLAASVPPLETEATPVEVRSLTAFSPTADMTLVLALTFKGAHIGMLELRDRVDVPFSNADVTRLQPFADAAAVAIENARLYDQARLSATLAERNRLARELHDTIAQGLTAVTMQLEAAQRSFDRDPARARTRLKRAYDLTRDTLTDVRRSVWTLAAPLVDGQALPATLDDLAQRFAARTGLPVSYRHDGPPPRCDHATAAQVLRIVQEALQNVEKHAQATDVTVGSETRIDALCFWVQDNGVGFAPDAPAASAAPSGTGFGLIGLRERVRLIGGTLQIESAPGAGTRVTLTIPIASRLD
jgi:signal transduction histidine kinase